MTLRTDHWFWSEDELSIEGVKEFHEHEYADNKRRLKSIPLAKVDQKMWQGKQQDLKTPMTKMEAGDLGEQIIVSYLRKKGFKDADSLNEVGNNFPLDIAHNHEVLEVKAGLASNVQRAQQWRNTIGEPGIKEKEWLKTIDAETKAAWGLKKSKAILARKKKILSDFTSNFGKKVVGKTATVIINPDTQIADLFMFDGFHKRIGWNSEQTKEGYIGSFRYGTAKLSLDYHQPGKHPQKRHGRRKGGRGKKNESPDKKLLTVAFLGKPSARFEDALFEGLDNIPADHQSFLTGLLRSGKLTEDIDAGFGIKGVNILGVPDMAMFKSQHPDLETAWGWYDWDNQRSHAAENIVQGKGNIPLFPKEIRTVTRHELGHAIDHAIGISKGITDSNDPFYSSTLVEFDKARLNDWLDADQSSQEFFGHFFGNVRETFAESYNFLVDKKNKDVDADFEEFFPKSIEVVRKILEENGLSIPSKTKKFHTPGGKSHPQIRHGRRGKNLIVPHFDLATGKTLRNAVLAALKKIPEDHQEFALRLLNILSLGGDFEDTLIIGVDSLAATLNDPDFIGTAGAFQDRPEGQVILMGESDGVRDAGFKELRHATSHEFGHALDFSVDIKTGPTKLKMRSDAIDSFEAARIADTIAIGAMDPRIRDTFDYYLSSSPESFAESYSNLVDPESSVNGKAFVALFPRIIKATQEIIEDQGLSVPGKKK